MDKKLLLSFISYQHNILHEEYEYEKYSDLVVTDPLTRLVSYYIYLQYEKGEVPMQTDLIYALKIPHSNLRKILAKLIKAKYIAEVVGKDARFTYYRPTKLFEEGSKIWVARHIKTWLIWAKKLGFDSSSMDELTSITTKQMGPYSKYPAYGNFDLKELTDIMTDLKIL